MKSTLTLLAISTTLFFSCQKNRIQYELYSNGAFVFEILPKDIEFYDTAQIRDYSEIHEMRLKDGFYKQDSFIMHPPIVLICKIDGKQYFWSDIFHSKQPEPRLWVNFNFRSSCKNYWTFPEQEPGKLILRTKNECNAIEFFHLKNRTEYRRERYYNTDEYFRNYVDTARLAHEILLDPYYLKALRESGVEIR
ncbi:hypothetical protein DS62_11745 [Smithella sp. SC_K08D17]|nr:hypothetical protein DS62_11745 [Smithella sp. SC_K08D17]